MTTMTEQDGTMQASAEASSMNTLSDRLQKKILIFTFLLVPVTLLLVFSFYPATRLFYLSLMDWDGFSPAMDFIWFENFIELVYWDPDLLRPLLNSIYYFIGSLIQLGLALWFAVILNEKLPGSAFFKMMLFLPFVLNQVASAFVFRVFYQVGGALDGFLMLIGLQEMIQPWLMDRDVVPWSLVGASVWRYLGFNLVICFAALQSVPKDLYEAATIDGAGDWQKFRFITLPSIKMMLLLQVLLSLVGSLEVFEIPLLITGGANGTMTFVMATVEQAFEFQAFGLASAMAVLLLFIVFAGFFVQRFFDKGDV
jgi:multiple sugar transport system permease protein